MALPEQDKLQVLASLFGVEPHELRFGRRAGRRLAESQGVNYPTLGAHEREVIDAFLALSPKRRELVSELVIEQGRTSEKR